MSRAVVLGGSGFIGSHVVAQLLACGCRVTDCSRGSPGRKVARGVEWLQAPPGDGPLVGFPPGLFSPWPDVVVHMIAMGAEDGEAAAIAFEGRCGRFLLVGSADVYLAYGRFIRLEPGPPVPTPLDEKAARRTRLFPYRKAGTDPADLAYRYDKILAEDAVLARPGLEAAVLRLPKVYGRGGNGDLATVYGFAGAPDWHWTHGYVENVAAAIVFAALRAELPDRIYNLGEEETPTVAERLRGLPPARDAPPPLPEYDFAQDLHFDTGRLRALGFRDPISHDEGIRLTISGQCRGGARASRSAVRVDAGEKEKGEGSTAERG